MAAKALLVDLTLDGSVECRALGTGVRAWVSRRELYCTQKKNMAGRRGRVRRHGGYTLSYIVRVLVQLERCSVCGERAAKLESSCG